VTDEPIFDASGYTKPSGCPEGVRAVWKVTWTPEDGWHIGETIYHWSADSHKFVMTQMSTGPLLEYQAIAPALSDKLARLRGMVPPF